MPASIESAVEAIRRGAVEDIEKPVKSPDIDQLHRRVSTLRQAERDRERFQEALERAVPAPRLTTENKKTAEVYAMARRAAKSDATILIRGESGSGKGVLARAIHRWSDRSRRPFLRRDYTGALEGAAGERALRTREGCLHGREVPPLRERPEDILPLAESFVAMGGLVIKREALRGRAW